MLWWKLGIVVGVSIENIQAISKYLGRLVTGYFMVMYCRFCACILDLTDVMLTMTIYFTAVLKI